MVVEVFVHHNDGAPKLWAADLSARKVVFGSLVYGTGGVQERVVANGLAERIKGKIKKGYEKIGQVQTTLDAMVLVEMFNAGGISTQPIDPAPEVKENLLIITQSAYGDDWDLVI